MKTLRSLGLACAVAFGALGTTASATTSSGVTQDIVQTAVSTPGFSTLVALLGQADLVDTLQGPGPFTVFAPTDDAFAALDPNLVAYLTNPANVADLRSVLLYHVAGEQLTSSDVLTSPFVSTLNGQRAYVTFFGGLPRIDGAVIAVTDIVCTNGIIHVLDHVMQPNLARIADTAASTARFDTLLAAVGAANLATVLDSPGPFTVLAPTDLAFAQLPAGVLDSLLEPQNQGLLTQILTYHVIPGRVYSDVAWDQVRWQTVNGAFVEFNQSPLGAQRINGARVLRRDIDTANGVVYAIDKVLIPQLN